ncbi:MAG TPA: hypothetical protein VK718_02960 [Ferruginibacter sp.]|jgi:hypothetical protein|nr:hypothetical protein [Ferruginibacter sp.]
MKNAEEILANEFDCKPADLGNLHNLITHKINKSKIIHAMEAFGKLKFEEARQDAVRTNVVKRTKTTTAHHFIRTMNESLLQSDDKKQCNDTMEWIKRVIDSCNNTIHFEYAQVLVDLFKEKCQDELEKLEIQDYYNLAFNEVHFVIK